MLQHEQLTDIQLLDLLHQDDQAAFEVLYHRYKRKIYHFIVRLSQGDYYLAEETTQAVFICLWENRMKATITYSLNNWLYTVSRNLFLNHVSRKLNETIALSSLEHPSERLEDSVSNEVELKLLMDEIERVIAKLPPARQRVYRMRHIEHLSQKEIAAKLNLTENTVESYLKESNKFLQLMLKPYKNGNLNVWLPLLLLFITL